MSHKKRCQNNWLSNIQESHVSTALIKKDPTTFLLVGKLPKTQIISNMLRGQKEKAKQGKVLFEV